MSFAFTTSPAGQSSETATQYLSTASKTAELRTLSAVRPQVAAAAAVSVVPVSEQALLASRDVEEGDGGQPATGPTAQELAMAIAAATATPLAATVASAAESPSATPVLDVGDRITATVSFYYCRPGDEGLHPGDGGGFCGHMRNGDLVYSGAAACAYEYLGQRFRIQGDPLSRVYTCADTGNAVLGLHRDIWFYDSDDGWDWQLDIGQAAVIEIVP
jgi:hypothetical protein